MVVQKEKKLIKTRVSLTEQQYYQLQKLVQHGFYASLSEAIRHAVSLLLKQYELEGD